MPTRRFIKIAYHLVDIRNFESIQEHGLLSATKLIEMSANVSPKLNREHRAIGQHLDIGAYIRDQRPMPPSLLSRCLQSHMQPGDWYELLNSKIFFWLDLERLNRHRNAYRLQEQIVLAVDAREMLSNYGAVAAVSPINTGNAMRAAAKRDRSTFVPYESWVVDAWKSEIIPSMRTRPSGHRPAELTIANAIPDIKNYVIGSAYLAAAEAITKDHLVIASNNRT
jgi:hypothetical protein